jgi:N6-adenosine-specific RNA methylase IME4
MNEVEATQIIEFDRAEIVEANQAYGALTEGLYLASFTFERAMAQALRLLKDGGWRLVGGGFDDVNDFVRSLRLDQFKVIAEQRKDFAQRVKELQPQVSNRAIAGALGVGHDTVDRDLGRGAFAPAGQINAKENNAGISGRGAFAPVSAPDGKRDARLFVQRGERAERREEKLRGMGEAARLEGTFSVLYGDPPWEDEFGPTAGQHELHFPVMSTPEICALPVRTIAAEHAVLLLWALPHMLLHALEVMDSWGFCYRTNIVWAKDKPGLGQWVRQEHELLLIGRKGSFPPPAEKLRVGSVLKAPLGRLGEKPEIVLELIERWWPDAPKIELFARGRPRPGWTAWGNEVKAE